MSLIKMSSAGGIKLHKFRNLKHVIIYHISYVTLQMQKYLQLPSNKYNFARAYSLMYIYRT